MLAEADYLTNSSSGIGLDEFLSDGTPKRAFVRSIEIIGEAAKHVPEEFRDLHPHFERRAMAGMRDRLIHGYFGVDHELIWDVVINSIPQLQTQLGAILTESSDD